MQTMIDIWLYGIIPAFFVFGILAYSRLSTEAVSIIKLIGVSIVWPICIAILICAFIGATLR